MKFKWKYFIITSVVCLLPILLGILIWDKLPDTMAIHFDINGNPDGFASKGFTVFGLPVLMVVMQGIGCFVTDLNAKKYGEAKKFDNIVRWIIPSMTIILELATFGVGLGYSIDMRIVATVILGVMFLLMGSYMPELHYVKNYDIDMDKARKINKFLGTESVVMGILFLISAFLPPVATMICLFLLIPYIIIGAVYGLMVARNKD